MDGASVDEWVCQGAFTNHYYAKADATQQFVRFMEHKASALKQWDVASFSGTAPSASFFKPPTGAGCSEKCTSFVCKAMRAGR